MPCLEPGEPLLEIRSEDIPDPEAVAAYLVCVGRADTLEGGANLALACGCLVCGIQKFVRRKDEMSLLGNVNPLLCVNAHLCDIAAFLAEGDRVENDSASYDVGGTLAENAGRDAPHHEIMSVEMQGMACVRAALESGHGRISSGQHVHDFSFAFVSPLEAENNVKCHIVK